MTTRAESRGDERARAEALRAKGPESPRLASQVFGFFGAIGAWAASLMISYPLVEVACAAGAWSLVMVNLALIAVGGASVWVAWKGWRLAQESEGWEMPIRRVGFVSFVGVLLGSIGLVIMIGHLGSMLLVGPCL